MADDSLEEKPVPAPAPADGITCPRCRGVEWRVWSTRAMTGRLVRVRTCTGCYLRVRTREVIEAVVGDAEEPDAAQV